ncbi:MAG: FAD synthetase family protein [Bacillota bacterium]|nr:FAD synthetase family protein [Bacillota bacterium]MDP4154565.1 FAD synthetase family protein [Bacillota bacterium]
MKIVRLSYPIEPFSHYPTTSMAIGYFDGVHRGHQVVIQNAIKQAKTLEILSSVMTFDPHPKSVLGSEEHTSFITPLPDKLGIFENMGVDLVYVVSFNQDFSLVSPSDFVERLLASLEVKYVTVGFDFSFGFRGIGKAHDLKLLSKSRFRVQVISSVNSQVEKISSTNIRKALQIGNIEKANYYLGRRFSIHGIYQPDHKHFFMNSASIIPAMGSYIVGVEIKDQMIYGMLYINHEDKVSPYRLELNDPPSFLPECLDIKFIHLNPRAAFQLEENHFVI